MAPVGLHHDTGFVGGGGAVTVTLAGVPFTTPQIAALAGWSIDYTQRIVDTYLPRRAEVALAGMLTWEASGTASPTSNVVRLSSATPSAKKRASKRK